MKTDAEKSLEAPGKVPRIVQVMYFKEAPRPSANQQPEQSLPQVWEAQWQQFLKTVQHSHAGWGNPQLTEAVPWDDTKAFLAAFEQVAEACRWPREEWVARLLPALRGGMEQIYCRLDARERGDYGKVKSALLRGDAMRTESKRQHFRQCCYQECEGPRRIYGHLQDLCRQWLKPEHRTKEQILELIIQEQLLAMLPPEVQNWVRECAPEDCVEAVALAEDFLMGRRASKMWEWPVPLQQIAASSREAEGPLADATARQRYTNLSKPQKQASERMSMRNAGLMLPPERHEMSGSGLTEGLANLKDRTVALQTGSWTTVNVDQKPSHWELAQGNCGNVNGSEDLLVPTSDIISQPNQEGTVFTHITETGETIPGVIPAESRILTEIKIESYEDADSEAEGSFEALTEDSQEDVPLSPELCEEDPRRKLRPREPPGGKQDGSLPQRTSVELRGKKSALEADKKQKEKKHQCKECGHRTYYLSDLLRHMNTHNGKRPYRCTECRRTFSKLSSFETHQKIHAPICRLRRGRKPLNRQGEGNHLGSRRGRKPASASALAKPMEDSAEDKPYRCQDCGQSFRWMSSLCRHWRIRGCRKNLPGQLRRGAIESKEGLAGLLEKAPGAFSRATRACTVTPAISRLRPRKPLGDIPEVTKARSSVSQDKRKHVCPDCGRRCAKIQDLIEHVRIHTGEKPYECPKCDRTFRWTSNFLAHQRKCHVKRPPPSIPLEETEASHTGDEPLCKVKQEEIKSEDQYGTWPEESPGAASSEASEPQGGEQEESAPPSKATVSVKKPTGYTRKKRYPCTQCGRKFLRLSNMLLHTQVHSEEKPYECYDCGKTFQWASNLAEHQKTHRIAQKDPAPSLGLAECDVILEDEEELIHILERNFQKGGTMTLPEESQDAASDSTEDCETRAGSKLRPRVRAGRRQGVSTKCLKAAAVAKKSKYAQKERKHKCNVCGHRTFYLSDLLRHMRVHSRERPYKCLECGKAFTQNSALLFHQRRDSCGSGSPRGRKGLMKSVAGRKGERGPRGRKRTHKLGLVKGKRSCPEKSKLFTCEECGQGFTWSSNLCRHRKLHRNDGDASHVDAGSSKPNKMMVENSPQPRATLKRMGSTSAEITPGVASVTVVINDGGWKSKNQATKKLAAGNLATKGAGPAGRSLYSKSGEAYRYTNGLAAAQKAPAKKKYQCKVCKKSFAIKCHLVDHENSHTGAKPYECNECGKRFAWKAKLYRHQKIHTGVKSYQCPECDKTFFRKDSLMVHLKSHGSSCAYQCLQCGRRFSERDQLFRHQQSHAGLHPYECGECGQGFGQEDIWIKHQQKHRAKK